MNNKPVVIYLAAAFPKLSETFVYREFLGLRNAGWDVRSVALNPNPNSTGDAQIDALADDTLVLYARGKASVCRRLPGAFLRRPWGTIRTLCHGLIDAMRNDHQNPKARLTGLWHAMTGAVLADEISDWQAAHLHAHMAHAPTSVAMYAAIALNISFSFTGHAADLFRDRQLLKTKLKRTRFTVSISHWHRSFYQQLVPRPDAVYPVVRCPVDTDKFAMACTESKGPVQLLSVCRLVAKKGIEQLLDALAILKERNVDFECNLIGDGPELDKLVAQASRLDLLESVHFHGSQPNGTVRQFMRQADVFVLPCQIDKAGDRDGIPVALMEAMASGVAVVSGSLPAIHELITPGESGLLVPPNSPNELAAAVRWLIEDARVRQSLAAKGRFRVVEEFSLKTNTDRLTAILTEAI